MPATMLGTVIYALLAFARNAPPFLAYFAKSEKNTWQSFRKSSEVLLCNTSITIHGGIADVKLGLKSELVIFVVG